jgi:hypothetical protein
MFDRSWDLYVVEQKGKVPLEWVARDGVQHTTHKFYKLPHPVLVFLSFLRNLMPANKRFVAYSRTGQAPTAGAPSAAHLCGTLMTASSGLLYTMLQFQL